MVAAIGALGVAEERRTRCADAAESVARVWTPPRRKNIDAAFAGVDWVHATDAWRRFEAEAETWVDDWSTLARSSCVAAKVEHTLDQMAYESREVCLQASLERFDAVLTVLEDPTRELAFTTPSMALTLVPPTQCERPPHPANSRANGDGTRALAHALGFIDAGRPQAAVSILESVRDDAVARGDAGVAARVNLALGLAHLDVSPDESEASFDAAFWGALAAADDDTLAQSAEQLGGHLVLRGALEDAEHFIRLADVVNERLGASATRRAGVVSMRARLQLAQNDPKAALASFAEALELVRGEFGPNHPRTLQYVHNLAEQSMLVGDLPAARELASLAHVLRRDFFGPRHPLTARSLGTLAKLQGYSREHARAVEMFERARSIFEEAHGPDSIDVAVTDAALATSLSVLRKLDEADAASRRAIAALERATAPTDRRLLAAKMTLARSLVPRGRCSEAIPSLRDVVQRTPGEGMPRALAKLMLAACLLAHDKPDQALSLLEEARPVFEAQPDKGASVDVWIAEAHRQRGELDRAVNVAKAALDRLSDARALAWARRDLLHRLASIEMERGDVERAVASSVEAIASLEVENADPGVRIDSQASHARILLDAGRTAEAVSLAEVALSTPMNPEAPALVRAKLHFVLARARQDGDAARKVVGLIPEGRDPEYAQMRREALAMVDPE